MAKVYRIAARRLFVAALLILAVPVIEVTAPSQRVVHVSKVQHFTIVP